jgi:hypothetical protein
VIIIPENFPVKDVTKRTRFIGIKNIIVQEYVQKNQTKNSLDTKIIDYVYYVHLNEWEIFLNVLDQKIACLFKIFTTYITEYMISGYC